MQVSHNYRNQQQLVSNTPYFHCLIISLLSTVKSIRGSITTTREQHRIRLLLQKTD